VLCDDLELPSAQFVQAIASSIRQQCDQFSVDMIPEDEEDRRVIIKVRLLQRGGRVGLACASEEGWRGWLVLQRRDGRAGLCCRGREGGAGLCCREREEGAGFTE